MDKREAIRAMIDGAVVKYGLKWLFKFDGVYFWRSSDPFNDKEAFRVDLNKWIDSEGWSIHTPAPSEDKQIERLINDKLSAKGNK